MVASSAPAAARSKATRCAAGSRSEYQTELVVGTPHADSRSPASVVAPTVVPLIDAGRLWIACAPASASLAGGGVGGGALEGSVVVPSPAAPAASTMATKNATASAPA